MRRAPKLVPIVLLIGTCSLACGGSGGQNTDAVAHGGGGVAQSPGGAPGTSGMASGGSALVDGTTAGGGGMTAGTGGVTASGGSAACMAPQVSCANAGCVDVASSDQHCGSCDVACAMSRHCAAGNCECSTGQTACGDACVDLQNDPLHCGTCDHACGTGGACKSGQCMETDGCVGPAGDVTLSRLVIYQSVAIPLMQDQKEVAATARKADVIAGREALLRAFVTLGAGWQAHELSARIHLSDSSGPLKDVFVKATPKVSSTDATLTTTFNLTLPKELVKPDTRYSFELVGCAAAQDASASPRFPAAGDVPLGAKTTGPLKVHFVPFNVGGKTPDSSDTALTQIKQYVEALYPVTELQYTLGAVFQATGTDLDLHVLLDQLYDLRSKEHPADDVYYFALAPGYANGIDGTSSLPGPDEPDLRIAIAAATAGDPPDSFPSTIAHELGHNHGLEHSPGCGASDPDPKYPYIGKYGEALLGSWGYDRRLKLLIDPLMTYDNMSYCGPRWTSDYVYEELAKRVAHVNGADQHVSTKALARISDWRVLIALPGGTARWGHPHTGRAPSRAAEPATVFDALGQAIATVDVYRIPTEQHDSSFILIPSPAAGWSSVQVSGLPPAKFE